MNNEMQTGAGHKLDSRDRISLSNTAVKWLYSILLLLAYQQDELYAGGQVRPWFELHVGSRPATQ